MKSMTWNRKKTLRLLAPAGIVVAVTGGAFLAPIGVASADSSEVEEGSINCDYTIRENSHSERLWDFRESRDAYLGFDSEVVRESRLEGKSTVDIAADYGMDVETLLVKGEEFHSYCYNQMVVSGEIDQEAADIMLANTMERFEELMYREPDESGRGQAGLGARDADSDVLDEEEHEGEGGEGRSEERGEEEGQDEGEEEGEEERDGEWRKEREGSGEGFEKRATKGNGEKAEGRGEDRKGNHQDVVDDSEPGAEE